MQGFDVDRQNGTQFDERGVDLVESSYPWLRPFKVIVIVPPTSSWLGFWKFIIRMLLFWGYFNDPKHFAFFISKINLNWGDDYKYLTTPDEIEKIKESTSLFFEFMVDIFMALDILLNFITAYQRDVQWITCVWLITKNYAKGSMIFDLIATIPGLISFSSEKFYYVKLFRLVHARVVYSSISEAIRFILSKFGLNKANVEKVSYTINLLIYMFSAIHILGCAWIYIGRIVPCSWLN